MSDTRTATDDEPDIRKGMGLFERWLTVWVGLAIIAGIAIGQFAPEISDALSRYEYAQVSIPVAILIWAMIFPMMVQIDFGSILGVRRQSRDLVITTTVNWLIKPFTMFAIAWFFLLVVFEPLIPTALAGKYLASAALATVVGVLVEVPLMPAIVRIANRTRGHFPAAQPAGATG